MDENLLIIQELRLQILELEDKIQALRIGRRVLLNLLNAVEKAKDEQLSVVQVQNERLQRHLSRYTRVVLKQNRKIDQLEQQIKNFSNMT
jgi:CII-binding regulator of phage lambda lysogenization HflD